MKTRVLYARILICTILILSSVSLLALAGASKNPSPAEQANYRDHVQATKTRTVTTTATKTFTEWNGTTTSFSTTTTTTTRWNATTRWNITTQSNTIALSPTILWVFPVDHTTAGVVTAAVLGLAAFIFMLTGSALVLRSRSIKALEEANIQRRLLLELQSRLSGVPETASSASFALKRLLELGILQPKEYMEKKMLAERMERKTSAKQLLDEGLISKEQYDALVRGEEGQD